MAAPAGRVNSTGRAANRSGGRYDLARPRSTKSGQPRPRTLLLPEGRNALARLDGAPRGVPAGQRGSDHYQNGSNSDRNQPADPVDPCSLTAAERGVEEPAQDHAADSAQDREPDRNVVLVARGDELAEHADHDARDDDPNNLHAYLPVVPDRPLRRSGW